MISNKILSFILRITSIVVFPVQIITTLILGLLVRFTVGLLLIPLSLIWAILFLFPLLGLSYVYEKIPVLRIPVALIGIPLAVVGNVYSLLIPAMGETESRFTKLLITESFPFSWHFYQLNLNNPMIEYTKGFPVLLKILNKVKINDAVRWNYISELKIQNGIDL